MYTYEATLIKIIDGDTIDAMVDLGFNMWIEIRIRLNGIDTPEIRTRDLEEKAKGFVAKKRLTEVLRSHSNKFIIISHGRDKYGRCLGEIMVEGNSVNQLLIDEGLAIPYDGGKKKKMK